jgi:hypothetical protein
MNALPRCLLCALTAQTLLFGISALQPDLAERLNLNVWTVPERERQIEQAQREMDQADSAMREVQIHLERRKRIADDVAAGRVGLLEAAARFRELNATALPTPFTLQGHFAGLSEEERCCRQVIEWVRIQLAQKSSADAELIAQRLEEELSEHLRHNEAVRLSQDFPLKEEVNRSINGYRPAGCLR